MARLAEIKGVRRTVASIGPAALGLAAALALAATGARAEDPGDTVPGHPGVTWLDLIKQKIPDLAWNAADKAIEGHLAQPLTHLAGRTYQTDPPDPVVLSFISVRRIHAGGQPRIVVMADLGQAGDVVEGTTMLALYDDASTPKLLDAVDVGVDKDTAFDAHDLLPLGPGDDALVTYSEHFNSNQTYAGRLLLFVRDDRFQLIAHVFTLSDRYCGYERAETPMFSTRPQAASPYPRIDLVVTETLKRTGEDCDDDALPTPYTRSFRATYRWDAGKGAFAADESGLDTLDKENEARF
jgi:hypothetical protein